MDCVHQGGGDYGMRVKGEDAGLVSVLYAPSENT